MENGSLGFTVQAASRVVKETKLAAKNSHLPWQQRNQT
jgi:hypothetical protein